MKKAFLYLIYVGIVVGISVAIGLTFRNDTNKKPQVAQMPAGQAINKTQPKVSKPSDSSKSSSDDTKSKTDDTSSSTNQSTPTTSNTTPSATPKTSTPAPTTSSSDATATLVNSGPGSIVALFAVSFIVGSFGFARYQRKTL